MSPSPVAVTTAVTAAPAVRLLSKFTKRFVSAKARVWTARCLALFGPLLVGAHKADRLDACLLVATNPFWDWYCFIIVICMLINFSCFCFQWIGWFRVISSRWRRQIKCPVYHLTQRVSLRCIIWNEMYAVNCLHHVTCDRIPPEFMTILVSDKKIWSQMVSASLIRLIFSQPSL